MNIDSEQTTGVSKATPGVKSRAKLLKRLKSDAAQSDRQKFFLKSKCPPTTSRRFTHSIAKKASYRSTRNTVNL